MIDNYIPPPELSDKHFFILNMLIKKYRNQAHTDYLSKLDVTLEMCSILKTIEYLGSASQQQIANRVNSERSSVKRLIDNLIKRDLVLASKCEHNKKIRLIMLTENGKQLLNHVSDYLSELQDIYLKKITEEEAATLLRITKKLLEND